MQHHRHVPRKIPSMAALVCRFGATAINLARRSIVRGRSDDPVPIPASLSLFWLEIGRKSQMSHSHGHGMPGGGCPGRRGPRRRQGSMEEDLALASPPALVRRRCREWRIASCVAFSACAPGQKKC
jgi:hypothetical protein